MYARHRMRSAGLLHLYTSPKSSARVCMFFRAPLRQPPRSSGQTPVERPRSPVLLRQHRDGLHHDVSDHLELSQKSVVHGKKEACLLRPLERHKPVAQHDRPVFLVSGELGVEVERPIRHRGFEPFPADVEAKVDGIVLTIVVEAKPDAPHKSLRDELVIALYPHLPPPVLLDRHQSDLAYHIHRSHVLPLWVVCLVGGR
mmetsp:Transcript_26254/g.69982  ORF Transcript_26254/g.69982 Transcript_26254/m.69982 type:complete len:200 (-) Transcript_26254:550-1149(-)